MTPEIAITLYDHDHCFGLDQKAVHAKKLHLLLGAGEHKIGDRTVVVAEPVVHEGWTEYKVSDKVSA